MSGRRWFVLCADTEGRPHAVAGPLSFDQATETAGVFLSDGDSEALVVNTAGFSRERGGRQ